MKVIKLYSWLEIYAWHGTAYVLLTDLQRTSQNIGVGYNAPECTNPSTYTLKSDVYSLGVVMLELLTGRMPLDRYCCIPYLCFFCKAKEYETNYIVQSNEVLNCLWLMHA